MTGLPPDGSDAIEALLELLAADPAAPSSIRDLDRARDVHVADSLSGLEVEELREAGRIADLGTGAGFPGLVIGVHNRTADRLAPTLDREWHGKLGQSHGSRGASGSRRQVARTTAVRTSQKS